MTEELIKAQRSIFDLTESMDLATNLDATCGRHFEALRAYLALISADYTELYANTTAIMGFLSCDTVHPIYVELTHDIACADVPPAGAWAICSLFIISFFSMLMITFRSSWLETLPPGSSILHISSIPESFLHDYEAHSDGSPQKSGVSDDHDNRDRNDYATNGQRESFDDNGSGNDRKFPKSTRNGDSENRTIDGYTSRSKGSSGDNSDRNRSDDGYESVGYDIRLRRDKNFHIAEDKDDYDDYDMDDYNDYPRISGSEDDDEWAGVLDDDGHYLITS